MHQDVHVLHPAIIKRLKNAEGHIRSIIAMLQEERSCLEVAQQLQAVEKAIESAKKTLVHDHLDACWLSDEQRLEIRSTATVRGET